MPKRDLDLEKWLDERQDEPPEITPEEAKAEEEWLRLVSDKGPKPEQGANR